MSFIYLQLHLCLMQGNWVSSVCPRVIELSNLKKIELWDATFRKRHAKGWGTRPGVPSAVYWASRPASCLIGKTGWQLLVIERTVSERD